MLCTAYMYMYCLQVPVLPVGTCTAYGYAPAQPRWHTEQLWNEDVQAVRLLSGGDRLRSECRQDSLAWSACVVLVASQQAEQGTLVS